MQTTELDPMVSQTLSPPDKGRMRLIIGNKNYSSWSMRPWVLMKAFDVPFDETCIALQRDSTSAEIAKHSAAGRVPILLDGNTRVWDSLAICEYVAEQFPDKAMWPKDGAARAVARSICCEMHSGFTGLRSAMWMNIRARFPGKGRTAEAQSDIGRICEIWEDCLAEFGHHQFLFGDFSIADAYFAPVVMRFRTYGVSMAPALQAYMERVIMYPAVEQWIELAMTENLPIPQYDVYPD